ncbi:uncharacterized protein CIMG_02924 [Coccidioides immitis RS]|uniref:Bicarbonate transporter-like transmembrane domain-containing protein n=4 Tax=Coccidioides immitis TaxID=5501 RepID=J3KME2_COCIM|nr:uncharacterized protein CIMG_02924 [Coccidioides immitis RS]KMP10191.1 hypothetical protein CIRG_09872 [Coccidioides immitis RMSCC 2394]KMU74042.1 anion exchange family protein [Coccidioides immitis RMSCC 3703]KMU92361.1 anion exchange family protein [Coccidioides immitis H538.4]TPX24594.1 hypothetical protein DIZ76_010025 [Coccidioides immitis]EAS37570.3 hypothetical protein CIMG_02924 [Coccidioides immitis RS]
MSSRSTTDAGADSPPPLTRERTRDAYTYENLRGWKRYRILRPGRGIYHDIRRRLPYYKSDIIDGFTYRTIASTVRMYFVNLLPAIAYTLDMYRRAGEFFGINEALVSSALAAVVFSLLSAQPLTVVGITGLISLFNFTIYDIIKIYDVSIYPQFICWTGIWAAIFHWLVATWNWCDYMRYVTDFSSEAFGMYVGIIYLIKGVEELVSEFASHGLAAGYLSCLIGILYFGSIYALEKLGASNVLNPALRGLLADYAYPIGTVFWVGFSHIPGRLEAADIGRVPITRAFYPTQPRSWLIEFWNLDTKWIFVAIPFGFLTMLLFYYDHNVSSLTAQARQFPLKKPGGFHWDFFLLGCTTFVAGILGLPMPNGLVPQAPVHTDSLTIYETELKIISTAEGEGAEIRRPVVRAKAVVEQRLSHFFMALLLIGTMTGPLLIVLHTMPVAVFAGVFFIVGWGSIESNGILQKVIFLFREDRFIHRDEPLLLIRKRKVVLYVGLQMFGVACTVAISYTIAAIGFPVLICLLIPVRVWLLPRWFYDKELEIMDDLTANNKVVLASLGGAPILPEGQRPEDYGLERKYSEERHGVPRQRAGSLHR